MFFFPSFCFSLFVDVSYIKKKTWFVRKPRCSDERMDLEVVIPLERESWSLSLTWTFGMKSTNRPEPRAERNRFSVSSTLACAERLLSMERCLPWISQSTVSKLHKRPVPFTRYRLRDPNYRSRKVPVLHKTPLHSAHNNVVLAVVWMIFTRVNTEHQPPDAPGRFSHVCWVKLWLHPQTLVILFMLISRGQIERKTNRLVDSSSQLNRKTIIALSHVLVVFHCLLLVSWISRVG